MIGEMYARAGRYARLCQLLFLFPGVVELMQHLFELHAGFYDNIAAMKAAEHAPSRMVAGHFKVIALYLTGWWAVRFYACGDNPAAARAWDPRATALFVPVMAWGLFWLVLTLDGPMLAAAAGWPARPLAIGALALSFAGLLLEPCLSAWKAAAVVGNGAIGFMRSIRLTPGSYWWSLGMSLAATMPLMIVHYALAVAALGRTPAVAITVLGFDAVVVSYIGAVMMASTYVIARRVAARAGVALLPGAADVEQFSRVAALP